MPHSLEREKFMRHAPLRQCNFRNTHPCPGERIFRAILIAILIIIMIIIRIMIMLPVHLR